MLCAQGGAPKEPRLKGGRGGEAKVRGRDTGVRNGRGEAGREKKQGKGRKRFEGRREGVGGEKQGTRRD